MDTEQVKPVPRVKVPCEVYSRVVGYLRPVQNWNLGKQQEFKDRVAFDPFNISTGKESHNETNTQGSCTTS